jgi:hypothetical protein
VSSAASRMWPGWWGWGPGGAFGLRGGRRGALVVDGGCLRLFLDKWITILGYMLSGTMFAWTINHVRRGSRYSKVETKKISLQTRCEFLSNYESLCCLHFYSDSFLWWELEKYIVVSQMATWQAFGPSRWAFHFR